MRSQIEWLVGMLVIGILTSCTQVESNVVAFSKIENSYAGKSIVIVPADENQANSLEFAEYSKRLNARFAAAGMKPLDFSPTMNAPDYFALINYGIDSGRQVSRTFLIPTWGQTGVSSSYTSGTLNMYGNYGRYSGTTTYNPQYGITGYQTGVATDTVYGGGFAMDIYRPKTGQNYEKVYEAQVAGSGSCGNLGIVIDAMLDALFESFPAQANDQVEVSLNQSCN